MCTAMKYELCPFPAVSAPNISVTWHRNLLRAGRSVGQAVHTPPPRPQRPSPFWKTLTRTAMCCCTTSVARWLTHVAAALVENFTSSIHSSVFPLRAVIHKDYQLNCNGAPWIFKHTFAFLSFKKTDSMSYYCIRILLSINIHVYAYFMRLS